MIILLPLVTLVSFCKPFLFVFANHPAEPLNLSIVIFSFLWVGKQLPRIIEKNANFLHK